MVVRDGEQGRLAEDGRGPLQEEVGRLAPIRRRSRAAAAVAGCNHVAASGRTRLRTRRRRPRSRRSSRARPARSARASSVRWSRTSPGPSGPTAPGSPSSTRERGACGRSRSGWAASGSRTTSSPIDGTPCQVVIENRRLVHYPDRILELYPDEPSLRRMGAVSYMGVPLLDLDGTRARPPGGDGPGPMPDDPVRRALFEIFAGRAAAELRRLRAEREVRAREAQLAGLVEQRHGRHRPARRRAAGRPG